MRTEVAVYDLLRQRTTIPLPEIYGYDFRRDVMPSDYMFIGKMHGVPLRSVIDALPADEAQPVLYDLGQCMAQIHAITGDDAFGYFGRQPSPVRQTWRTAFLGMVAAILADASACGIALARPYDEIFARFEAVAAALDEIREPHLVHGDLWDANVFVIRRDGRWQIEGIIDCDRALWGDPDMEYSLSFRDGQDSFFAGYGRTLSEAPSARCRRQMYLAYLFLIVSVEVALRPQEADRSQWVERQLENALQELERFARQ